MLDSRLSRTALRARKSHSGCLIAGLSGRCSILVFFVLDRHRVDAAEPAVEVDIGAAPAAERPKFFHRRLAANRAGLDGGIGLGHAVHMGDRRPRDQASYGVEPTEADRITLAGQKRGHFVKWKADDVAVGAQGFNDEAASVALIGVAAGRAGLF